MNDLNEEDIGEWRIDLRNREDDVWYNATFSVKLEETQTLDGPNKEGPIVPVNRGKLLKTTYFELKSIIRSFFLTRLSQF